MHGCACVHMCVDVCICMGVHVCICVLMMHAYAWCACVHMCVDVCICVYVGMHGCMCAHVCTGIHGCAWVCMWVSMDVWMHILCRQAVITLPFIAISCNSHGSLLESTDAIVRGMKGEKLFGLVTHLSTPVPLEAFIVLKLKWNCGVAVSLSSHTFLASCITSALNRSMY